MIGISVEPLDDPIELMSGLPIMVDLNRSVRVKITDACGMSCTFCHNEGTPVAADNRTRPASAYVRTGRSGRTSIYVGSNGARFLPAPILADASFHDALAALRDSLQIGEVHLTGGEPTLHPDLPKLIRLVREAGFEVHMTSNGEHGADLMGSCAEAGLDSINFSVFGTTPEEVSAVQRHAYSSASRKIAALRASIDAAVKSGIRVGANVVVPDASHLGRVS